MACLVSVQSRAFGQIGEAPKEGEQKTLRILDADSKKTDSLHPLIPDAISPSLRSLLFTPMTRLDAKGNWKCELCDSFPTVANGQIKIISKKNKIQKMLVSWQLSEKARWGNGQPISGWDIKFTLEILKHIPAQMRRLPALGNLDSIIVDDKDPQKFSISFATSRYDFAALLAFPIIPANIEESIWLNAKGSIKSYLQQSNYLKAPQNPGLYSGDYSVRGIRPNGYLLSSSKFFSGDQKSKDINYKFGRINELRALEYDSDVDIVMLGNPNIQTLKTVDKLFGANSEYKIEAIKTHMTSSLVFNLRNPRMTDRRIRQAFVWASQQAMIEFTKTATLPAWQNIEMLTEVPETHINEIIADITRENIEKALNTARWRRGEDGLRSRNGELLEIELVVPQEDEMRMTAALFIKKHARLIGIDLKIKKLPEARFLTQVGRASFKDLILLEWDSLPGIVPTSLFHSSQIPSSSNNYIGQNIFGWQNKVVDTTLESMTVTVDRELWKELSTELREKFKTGLPFVPLYHKNNIIIKRKKLTSYASATLNTIKNVTNF